MTTIGTDRAVGPAVSAAARRVVEGGFDLHVHTAPSLRPKRVDAWTVGEEARAAGMGGVLLKDHDRPTMGDAHLVNREAPTPFRAYGSVCLNASVGGLNAAAVESAIALGTAAVFLPTDSAANDHSFWNRHAGEMKHVHVSEEPRRWTAQLRTLDDEATLRPEVEEVLRLCAAAGVLVCTGHLGADEIDVVVQRAAAHGARVVVTHAPVLTEADDDVLRRWAAAGALLELAYVFCCPDAHLPDFLRRHVAGEAALIERIGPASFVLSTDLGQEGNPTPAHGLLEFVDGLLAEGLTEDALATMVRDNPLRALAGSPPAASA
jgi:hypothetical protein